ncbi:hypothetical protein OROMI_025393 [Orobanche minor]
MLKIPSHLPGYHVRNENGEDPISSVTYFRSSQNCVHVLANYCPPPSSSNRRALPTTRIAAVAVGEGIFKWADSKEDSNLTAGSLSLTPNFILPVERRPDLTDFAQSRADGHLIPVIDLGMRNVKNHETGDSLNSPRKNVVIEEIARACEDYGLFQITNHGISEGLCQEMLDAVRDLFHLPPQVKARLVSDDSSKEVRICNHYRKVEDGDNNNRKKLSMWSEAFKHPWHPVDDSFALLLPPNPPNYCLVAARYAKEVGILMAELFTLMSQSLGMEDENYLQKRLGNKPLCRMQSNYYPPCPDPDLTLGLGVHTDRDALTVVLPTSNIPGLQIMKDDKWITVDPVPNALIVNIGDQLQVWSNGKYKSVLHRVVTNQLQSRISLATFYGPDKNALIGQIESLVDEKHPALYRDYYFREFLEVYRRQEGNNRNIKEFFQV